MSDRERWNRIWYQSFRYRSKLCDLLAGKEEYAFLLSDRALESATIAGGMLVFKGISPDEIREHVVKV